MEALAENKTHVLIAGGSGLIGKRLTEILRSEGFQVTYLSRKAGLKNGIKCYTWNPSAKTLDENSLTGVTHIINLAGESVGEKRWTKKEKKEILESRLNASATLLAALKNIPNTVKAVIAASATGIYGDRNSELLDENSSSGKDFLADVVVKWEASYDYFPVRVVKIRTGIVLSNNGGALPQMAKSIPFGITPVLGNGKQYMSWIHMDDLCRIYLFAIKNEKLSGPYNAVAHSPVTHRQFMKILRNILNKFSLLIPVPEFMLNIILGEQKSIVLTSANVSSKKITDAGFNFDFMQPGRALINIYEK